MNLKRSKYVNQALPAMVTLLAVIFIVTLTPVHNIARQQVNERKLVVRQEAMPHGVIEIKEIRGLQSSTFPLEFEVEIKNISDKPIYYIDFAAVLTESRPYSPNNRPAGFYLQYGHVRLSSVKERPQSDDIPIRPGDTAILRTAETSRMALRKKAEKDSGFADKGLSRVVLVLQRINFGDGNGYRNETPISNMTSRKK
jgi:hypothetical protein